MRGLVGGKNTIGRTAAVLKSPIKRPLHFTFLTAIGLTPGGSSTVHIYTQTVHRTTQLTSLNTMNNLVRTITVFFVVVFYISI